MTFMFLYICKTISGIIMAIDKINNQLNPYNMTQMQSIKPTKAINGQTSAGVNENKQSFASNNNPFKNNTVGINTNIGIGDTQNLQAMAGKPAAKGKTLAFA